MPGTIARSISPNDTAVEDGGLDSPTTAQFAEMARTFSQEASHGVGEYPNPFLDPSPQLDPSSPSFDAKEWARCLLGSMAGDPEKYPRQSIGVSWRDLSVHGFGRDTDYQKDVLNVLWQAPMIARNWISARQDKIQILRNFDGLVNPGDMVLVLGRPGRLVVEMRASCVRGRLADTSNQRRLHAAQDDRRPGPWASPQPRDRVQLPRSAPVPEPAPSEDDEPRSDRRC